MFGIFHKRNQAWVGNTNLKTLQSISSEAAQTLFSQILRNYPTKNISDILHITQTQKPSYDIFHSSLIRLMGKMAHCNGLNDSCYMSIILIHLQQQQNAAMLIPKKHSFTNHPQRYSGVPSNDQQHISVDFSSKVPSESLEKSVNASQFRQTMQMKRYKYQKMAFESKPANIHSFYQHYFAVEPMRSQMFGQAEQPRCRQHSRMLPMTSSNWVSNTKKAQSKWLSSKKSVSVAPNNQRQQPQRKFECEMNNQLVINDIKEYFYSMKQYLNNHKRKVERQRKIRVNNKNQTKKEFEEKDNLSIIRLKPSTEQKAKRHHSKQIQNQQENNQSTVISSNLQYYHSSNHIGNRSISRQTSFSIKSQTTEKMRKPELSIFKRQSSIKQQEYHFIFGRIKDTMSEEEIQKLKTLYYRDFIWKIWYNRGFAYEPTQEVFKYYVGKGNNSRLVRRIMAKRPWWFEESKMENAHFVWTQLKVYEAYKSQRAVAQSSPIQKDSFLLTNTQNSEKREDNPQCDHVKESQYLRGDKNGYILNKENYKKWRTYIKARGGVERKPKDTMKQRTLAPRLQFKKSPPRMTNHLQMSRVIGNKKALYRTMEAYFSYRQIDGYLPMTFHITGGLEDEEYFKFLREFYKKSKEGSNCWIVKPGELSNRGRDIYYCRSLKEIKDYIKQKKTNCNGSLRTYILQSYLQKPFLYQGRKFDLRHYLMVTSTQGQIRGYFYQQGYVRTTSYPYSLDIQQPSVHLTNDAVQKYLPQYGKFQKANKLSYQQLNEYMLKLDPKKGFYDVVFPQLRQIGTDIIRGAFPFIDPQRRANNFEIFGIDVMVDHECRCWLIQVNTNPCIEVNCAVLASVIPGMLDNAFSIALDSNFLPIQGKLKSLPNNYLQNNKFELVFDQATDGAAMLSSYKQMSLDIGNFGDDDDNYESCEEEDYES